MKGRQPISKMASTLHCVNCSWKKRMQSTSCTALAVKTAVIQAQVRSLLQNTLGSKALPATKESQCVCSVMALPVAAAATLISAQKKAVTLKSGCLSSNQDRQSPYLKKSRAVSAS